MMIKFPTLLKLLVKLMGIFANRFMITCIPKSRSIPYTQPTAADKIIPRFVSLNAVPMISQASRIVCTMMIFPVIDVGKPKPMTRPNDSAKLVAKRLRLSIALFRYCGKSGLSPS